MLGAACRVRYQGAIDGGTLEAWAKEVRKQCADCTRTEIGDNQIGKSLAAAPFDADGIWPPVASEIYV